MMDQIISDDELRAILTELREEITVLERCAQTYTALIALSTTFATRFAVMRLYADSKDAIERRRVEIACVTAKLRPALRLVE